MRKLVLTVALLAGCGDVTAEMTTDSAAESPPTCAAPDKATGRGTITGVTADVANPSPCYMDSWNTIAGATMPFPVQDAGGFHFSVTSASVIQTATACTYSVTMLVSETVLGSYECKWTTTATLTTAPQ